MVEPPDGHFQCFPTHVPLIRSFKRGASSVRIVMLQASLRGMLVYLLISSTEVPKTGDYLGTYYLLR